MRSLLRLVLLFVLAVIVFSPALPVSAQDPGEQEPTVIVENQTNLDAIYLLIAAAAGLLVGGGGVAVILSRANQNLQLKDSTEQLLANNVPPETVRLIHNLAEGAQQTTGFLLRQFSFPGVPEAIAEAIKQGASIAGQAADFVEAVTDNQPNTVSSFSVKGVPPITPAPGNG